MLLSSRFFRRAIPCLLGILSSAALAQTGQFLGQPQPQLTGGQVTSFQSAIFQSKSNTPDILYINAPIVSGTNSSITAGLLLNKGNGTFNRLGENQITFAGVSNVVSTVGDFDGDSHLDAAFALTTTTANAKNLCIYYGTGATDADLINGIGTSSFSGLPPAGRSFCTQVPTQGTQPPAFSYIAAFSFTSNAPDAGLILEDSKNGYLYILSVAATSVAIQSTLQLPSGLGPGPIYVGALTQDGNTDFVLNGQTAYSAEVYLGNGNGTFKSPVQYSFTGGVHSMLLDDMNRDGILDMVVEDAVGNIEIFPGNRDGTFSQNSIGGAGGNDMVAGVGGHLAAIDPNTLNILTTTPIGLSVLSEQASGHLQYDYILGPYNIGPGRSSYALTNFGGGSALEFAVDSPEGVAIVQPDANGDGGFQTSKAYTALAPALGATIGKFRNIQNNPNSYLDVVVATGTTQGILLQNIGSGIFVFPASPTNTSGGPANVPGTVWSNILSGDFDGDGNLDVLYSLTGLPSPGPSGTSFPVLYTQYGNGDGTFNQSGFTTNLNRFGFSFTSGNSNGAYFETVTGDFNGDGTPDVAGSDVLGDGVALGAPGVRTAYAGGFGQPDSSNTAFSQVATGFFAPGRTSQQDLVFQQGSNFIPYKNKLDNTGENFTTEAAVTGPGAPLYPATVLLTDVDGDGKADLVVVYYNAAYNPLSASPVQPNSVYIWWGNGDGTFQSPLVLNPSRNYYLGAVHDMNGDGTPDLVLSDGSLVSILFNRGTGRTEPFGAIQSSGLYLTEQHYLAGQGINSITIADVNGDGEPDLVVANGGLTISNPLALGGATATSLTLPANPSDLNTGGITVLLNSTTTQPVTGLLVASPEPSAYSATFTITATVTQSNTGVPAPTGTVQFSIDGNPVGSPVRLTPVPGSTTSATASYTVAAGKTYPGGVHPLTALYSGDAFNTRLTFSDVIPNTHNITGGATTTNIFMCIGPVAITCPAPPGTPSPTPPYVQSLSMYYGQIWNGIITTTSLDGSPLTGSVDLNDTYTGPAAPPTNPLCMLPVTGGSCPNSVGTTQGTSVGVNVLTGVYLGDASHTGSTSLPVAITVLPDLTTTATLTGTPPTSPQGQPVTFTATLTGNFAAPTGPVTFVELFPPATTATVLGTANFVPGTAGFTSTATFVTSTLPIGADSISATYAATQNFNAPTTPFPTIIENITAPIGGNFTLTVTPTTANIGVGNYTLLTVTVTPNNGFAQGVNLTCSNLPTETACTFNTPSIAAGGGLSTLFVQTSAPHTCGTTTPYFTGSNRAPLALPMLAGLLALILPGRRRWLRALLALAVAACITQTTGCTTCTDLATRPGTYTIQVTGTSTVTSEVQSQPVTITVTI